MSIFIDTWDEDVISTDRQSLDWENSELQKMQAYFHALLRALERDWRVRRNEVKEEKNARENRY